MNCREYIIEFEERGGLSEPARLHLTVCDDCQKTSERQTQIWLMIDRLQPVAAPSDFDFHVKARIAKGKPSDYQKSSFLPILRYVLPLSVAVLLLGIFVFNSSYFSDTPINSQTAQSAAPAAQNNLPINISSADQLAFAPPSPPSDEKIVVVPPSVDEKSLITPTVPKQTGTVRRTPDEIAGLPSNKTSRTKIESEAEGSSHVISLTPVTPPLLPSGFSFNANVADAPKIGFQNPIDDGETLKIIGIEFVTKGGKRTVKFVQQNSIAARSGVKIGDVIEEIKNASLTVQRGTEKLQIPLR